MSIDKHHRNLIGLSLAGVVLSAVALTCSFVFAFKGGHWLAVSSLVAVNLMCLCSNALHILKALDDARAITRAAAAIGEALP
jgi:hypothetical protein